jgi:hypothetical protein
MDFGITIEPAYQWHTQSGLLWHSHSWLCSDSAQTRTNN